MTSDSETLKDLTNIGRQAVTDYDELLRKYNGLVEDHEKTKGELTHLQKIVEPLYDEFGEIQTKLHVEQSLRTAAESYAVKVVKDNKKIKRQSAAILTHMNTSLTPINIVDIDIDEPSNDQDELIQSLNKKIAELQDEVVESKTELRKLTDDQGVMTVQLDTAIAEREEYRMKVEELQQEINSQSTDFKNQTREYRQLKRVSNLAYTDYTSLEERYQKEKVLRLQAETYARELQRKRDSAIELKRASLTQQQENGEVNGEVVANDEVKKMIKENEQLHKELSEQETKFRSEIEELQQQLESSADHNTIQTLEEKLSVLGDDLDKVNADLEAAKHENKHLKETLAKTEKQLQEFLFIPIPPPPPPPPGPPAGTGIMNILKSKKKKKDDKLQKVGVKKEGQKGDAMQSAISEMMARIQKGIALKSVDMNERKSANADGDGPVDMQPQGADAEEGGAMKEMHKYLVQMKTTRAIGQRSAPQTSNIDDELAKKFAARNRPDLDTIKERSASIDSSTQDNELTSKLNKQLNKQASLDSNTPPVAKPRGSVSKHSKVPPPVASKPDTPNELTAKLSARKAKIGESENAAGIENNVQSASQS